MATLNFEAILEKLLRSGSNFNKKQAGGTKIYE